MPPNTTKDGDSCAYKHADWKGLCTRNGITPRKIRGKLQKCLFCIQRSTFVMFVVTIGPKQNKKFMRISREWNLFAHVHLEQQSVTIFSLNFSFQQLWNQCSASLMALEVLCSSDMAGMQCWCPEILVAYKESWEKGFPTTSTTRNSVLTDLCKGRVGFFFAN